jgi:hypothetical protein
LQSKSYNSLEGNLERADSGQDLVGFDVGVGVGNKLAIDLIVDPLLGDLVNEDNCPG